MYINKITHEKLISNVEKLNKQEIYSMKPKTSQMEPALQNGVFFILCYSQTDN